MTAASRTTSQTYQKHLLIIPLINRGGVEDTRLEAKDTEKIRGQGQEQPY